MDKSYKDLAKQEKALLKKTDKVIRKDKVRDKKFEKEEKQVKKMKAKC